MELNEKTYEPFFMSYIDNELSAAQRQAVDNFVQSNLAYEQVLQDFKNSVIIPQDIEFEDKSVLYRFDQMDAKLSMDFKKTLYKKETTPIRNLWNKNLLRYSSIAAVLILILGTAVNYTAHKDNLIIASTSNKITQPVTIAQDNHTATANTILVNPALIIPHLSQTIVALKENTLKLIETATKTTSLMVPLAVQDNAIFSSSTAMQTNPIIEASEAIVSIEKDQINSSAYKTVLNESIYPTESFQEINVNESDRVIYISSIEIDSDKIRGFTRRLNTLFKRNKTDKQ